MDEHPLNEFVVTAPPSVSIAAEIDRRLLNVQALVLAAILPADVVLETRFEQIPNPSAARCRRYFSALVTVVKTSSTEAEIIDLVTAHYLPALRQQLLGLGYRAVTTGPDGAFELVAVGVGADLRWRSA